MSGVNVKSIVAEYLQAHSFDGLCSDQCGCGGEDLMICGLGLEGEGVGGCVPAKKRICPGFDQCDCGGCEADPGDPCYFAPLDPTKKGQ